jgi:hypothetical protein
MSRGIEMSADHPQVHPDNTLQSRTDMIFADQKNRMSIDTELRPQISATHYVPVTSSGFDSLGFILAILYTAMSTARTTIAILTTLFMAKELRKMMAATAPNRQMIAMITCICEALFFRMGHNA